LEAIKQGSTTQQARPHPSLKARISADLHVAEDLKNTGQGNLFVIFGEPEITLLPAEGGRVR
jgi:adenine-specific DNA-methyltransferase